jgi:hypothetical protein
LWKGLGDKHLILEEETIIAILQQLEDVLNGIILQTFIRCENSYERKITHIIAESFNLKHERIGEWDDIHYKVFDYQCGCRYCWQEAGKKYYRLSGVMITNDFDNILKSTRKNKIHRNQMLRNNNKKHIRPK